MVPPWLADGLRREKPDYNGPQGLCPSWLGNRETQVRFCCVGGASLWAQLLGRGKDIQTPRAKSFRVLSSSATRSRSTLQVLVSPPCGEGAREPGVVWAHLLLLGSRLRWCAHRNQRAPPASGHGRTGFSSRLAIKGLFPRRHSGITQRALDASAFPVTGRWTEQRIKQPM